MRKSTRRKSPRPRTPGAAHRFHLVRLEEWGPSQEQIAQHPEWADEVHRPPFLLVAARL